MFSFHQGQLLTFGATCYLELEDYHKQVGDGYNLTLSEALEIDCNLTGSELGKMCGCRSVLWAFREGEWIQVK